MYFHNSPQTLIDYRLAAHSLNYLKYYIFLFLHSWALQLENQQKQGFVTSQKLFVLAI